MAEPRQEKDNIAVTRDAEARVDELYQLPLDEFTAARNALAKDTGNAAIKKLDKPNLAAWAVNQLYWNERTLYDEVVKTSVQVRTAHTKALEGKTADVRAAEAFHAEAMRRAKDAIRRLLEAAGNAASDAVMTPVTETLDALPTADRPGRLTRPLRRTGFEALAGVTITTKARPAPEPVKKVAAPEGEKERRQREADARQLAMDRERLRFAEAAEREAEAAVERARRALERAERTRERIERELEEAAGVEKAARKDVQASESAYARAQADRQQLSKKVRR